MSSVLRDSVRRLGKMENFEYSTMFIGSCVFRGPSAPKSISSSISPYGREWKVIS